MCRTISKGLTHSCVFASSATSANSRNTATPSSLHVHGARRWLAQHRFTPTLSRSPTVKNDDFQEFSLCTSFPIEIKASIEPSLRAIILRECKSSGFKLTLEEILSFSFFPLSESSYSPLTFCPSDILNI